MTELFSFPGREEWVTPLLILLIELLQRFAQQLDAVLFHAGDIAPLLLEMMPEDLKTSSGIIVFKKKQSFITQKAITQRRKRKCIRP